MTLGLGRAALVRIPVERAVRAAGRTRSRRPSPPIAPPAAADRDRRDGRHDVVDLGRPGRRHRRRSPSARACGSTSMRRTPGPVAMLPDRRGAVRGLGARRLDRRQPAQVAVHAARRVAAADAPDAGPARRVQPRPGVPADARPRVAGPRLQRVHAAARAAVPGAQAVDPAALVRAGRAATADRAPPRAGRRRSPRWVDDDPDWERLAPVPFSTVCFRWNPAGGGRRGRARRARTPRSWTPSTGPARCSCRTPGSTDGSRSASPIGNLRTEPRARRASLGAAPRGGRDRA